MPPKMRQRPGDHLCGLANWHPTWMQRYATTKMFMAVYGLLGTIQAMSYMYFIVTLTTIEKRFKIPSQTTGIILSGNEISQIMLSLILSYIGGQRNRPRWIAWGIVFCGLSCYILALPHFIYGAGDDALQLTQEYLDQAGVEVNGTIPLVNSTIKTSQHLCGSLKLEDECDALLSIMPLILIFLSQFVLGVGNTLYYSLGQTYLDDNTKKTNTPLMLAIAMALRMIGPIFGFVIGYVSLNIFIDPTKTPLIDNKDPRWLGAWWFGWMILGTLMVLFSGLIGLFPKKLPKKEPHKYNSHMPQVLRQEEFNTDEGLPLGSAFSSNAALDAPPPPDTADFPKLKDFPTALMRLLKNKLLMYNNVSAVFYILGAAGYMTFLSKFMEVQFQKTAQSATIVVGPASIIGMITGLIGSGLIISKKKPSASKVLMWNVIVGTIAVFGQFSYMFLYCGDDMSMLKDGKINLTVSCNSNCSCEGISYAPICHEPTAVTYFSPCHAGCREWDAEEQYYSDCSCLAADLAYNPFTAQSQDSLPKLLQQSPTFVPSPSPLRLSSTTAALLKRTSTTSPPIITTDPATYTNDLFSEEYSTEADELFSRIRRSLAELGDVLKPGVCQKGCNAAFWGFTATSMVVSWLGSSGRIGNILVNYRSVQPQDKSFAQGLTLMLISLFSLIPGPIIFGRIIDSTCLVWTKTCSGTGNCQLHDQTRFRYYVNTLALSLTLIGVFFDFLVWYNGRGLDLYGDKDAHHLEEAKRKNKAITPLLDFPTALMRLLKNKLLMYNNISGIFYILGAVGYMTFLTKYMEVQFLKTAQGATIISGPATIIGMVTGLIVSGIIITKIKPSASKVLMWNVIVGFIGLFGEFLFLFEYCPQDIAMLKDGTINLTMPCNMNCSCDGVPYSPICHEPTSMTYFSPCHAGCQMWDAEEKFYSNCSCLATDAGYNPYITPISTFKTAIEDSLKPAPTFASSTSMLPTITTTLFQQVSTAAPLITTDRSIYTTDLLPAVYSTEVDGMLSRARRSLAELGDVLKPGACQKGCFAFWIFAIQSMIVNWFASSGRIGNILVNYRAVETADKSFAQGLTLMMISLFALIPGPILFGRIIDSTCLVWTETCSGKGNCQLYDQTSFRYYVNTVSIFLTLIGVLLDLIVWYYGRTLDLYGEKETQYIEEMRSKNKPITPLLAKK